MKIYITRSSNQYSIYKVSDNLVQEFEKENRENIVIKSDTISEALMKFRDLDKTEGIEFDSELIKYKTTLSQQKVIKNKPPGETSISAQRF